MSQANRDKAVRLLQHYMTLTMRKVGLKPDGDTLAELAECVDAIIDAAADKLIDSVEIEHTRRRSDDH